MPPLYAAEGCSGASLQGMMLARDVLALRAFRGWNRCPGPAGGSCSAGFTKDLVLAAVAPPLPIPARLGSAEMTGGCLDPGQLNTCLHRAGGGSTTSASVDGARDAARFSGGLCTR